MTHKASALFVLVSTLIIASSAMAQTNTFPSSGNVGVGTTTPQFSLDVNGYIRTYTMPPNDTTPAVAAILMGNRGPGGGEYRWGFFTTSPDGAYGLTPNGIELYEYPNNGQPNCCIPRMIIRKASTTGGVNPQTFVINGDGHVGIGVWSPSPSYFLEVAGSMHLTGNAVVDGNIAAKYQDVAEWVPASHSMEPGTVVVIDPNAANSVMPSTHAYDTRIAGVVSAQPGVLLGTASESKEKIATTGRVRVRVDASRHAIGAGDLLVTSEIPGLAMFSEPIDLGGVKIHRPGTIVGKALEPLDRGEGEILVLLSLQ
jgi:hypothetical protein